MRTALSRWILAAFTVGVIAACQPAETVEAPAADRSANEAAANTALDVWNTQDYEELDAVVTPDFRRHGVDQNAGSLAEMKEFMRQVHATYPDFRIESNETAYRGNVGFRHWTVTGTYSATGRRIEISGITRLRFQDGMLAEEWAYYDTADLQAQLGVESVPHVR